jgi:hypothetical protein
VYRLTCLMRLLVASPPTDHRPPPTQSDRHPRQDPDHVTNARPGPPGRPCRTRRGGVAPSATTVELSEDHECELRSGVADIRPGCGSWAFDLRYPCMTHDPPRIGGSRGTDVAVAKRPAQHFSWRRSFDERGSFGLWVIRPDRTRGGLIRTWFSRYREGAPLSQSLGDDRRSPYLNRVPDVRRFRLRSGLRSVCRAVGV